MPNPIVAIIKSLTIVFMSVVGVLFCKYRRFSPSNTHQCYRQLRNSPRSQLNQAASKECVDIIGIAQMGQFGSDNRSSRKLRK